VTSGPISDALTMDECTITSDAPDASLRQAGFTQPGRAVGLTRRSPFPVAAAAGGGQLRGSGIVADKDGQDCDDNHEIIVCGVGVGRLPPRGGGAEVARGGLFCGRGGSAPESRRGAEARREGARDLRAKTETTAANGWAARRQAARRRAGENGGGGGRRCGRSRPGEGRTAWSGDDAGAPCSVVGCALNARWTCPPARAIA
jgi:hypothetical protein